MCALESEWHKLWRVSCLSPGVEKRREFLPGLVTKVVARERIGHIGGRPEQFNQSDNLSTSPHCINLHVHLFISFYFKTEPPNLRDIHNFYYI